MGPHNLIYDGGEVIWLREDVLKMNGSSIEQRRQSDDAGHIDSCIK